MTRYYHAQNMNYFFIEELARLRVILRKHLDLKKTTGFPTKILKIILGTFAD